ncbi:MAG: hypothetical protein WA821_10395 [Anaerolineales bacterium]
MQTDKSASKNWLKTVETVGLIVVPLIIVLAAGLWLRSLAVQPVAQAKSAPTPTVENAPALPAGTFVFPGNEVPGASFESVYANGITFHAGNYRLSDGQLLADICFDMLDDSDWLIWDMPNEKVVDAQGHKAAIVSMSVIEIRYPPALVDGKMKQHIIKGDVDEQTDAAPGQKMGQRCDTIRYTLPSGFDATRFTITINSIARDPSEADTCSASDTPYMQKIQAALDKKKTGIKIKNTWEHGDGGGQCGIVIVQKPNTMSAEAAQSVLNDKQMFLDLFGIRGPWVFAGGIK